MIRSLKDVLVVSDMDGTLLTLDQRLLPCNLETIKLFTTLGGRFSVATGRIPESVERYTELLPYLSPGITYNGCVVYDFQNRQTLLSETLPRAVAKKAYCDVARQFPEVGILVFAADGQTYLTQASRETGILLEEENIRYLSRPEEDLPKDWNKIIFAGAPEQLAVVEEYIGTQSYPGAYFVMSSPIFFEMLPENVNKGTALLKLCKTLDIPLENTFAIGDYYNDIGMLQTAGYGVAVENAPADIRLLADEVVQSCENGGVGQFLYKLINLYG